MKEVFSLWVVRLWRNRSSTVCGHFPTPGGETKTETRKKQMRDGGRVLLAFTSLVPVLLRPGAHHMSGLWVHELLQFPSYPKLVWVQFLSLASKEYLIDMIWAEPCLGHQHWPWNRRPRTPVNICGTSKWNEGRLMLSPPSLWLFLSHDSEFLPGRS